MTTEQSKKVFREYVELFATDREAAIDRYVADPNLREHIVMFSQGLPGYQLVEEDVIAEGDKVVFRCTMVGTHAGELFGVPATGREVRVPAIVIYRIAEGKIVEFWLQADSVSLLTQIGAMPAPAAAE